MNRNIPELSIPIVRVRLTAALEDAGAWATSDWISCSSFYWLTCYFEYEQGAADGAVEWYLEFRPGPITPGATLGAYPMSAYAVGPVVAGADTASLVQRERVTYTSTAAGAEGFAWGPVAIQGTVEDFRLWSRETGVVGTPGDFGCDVEMAV